MKTPEEIRTIIQAQIDETFEGLDFYSYIDECDLTQEEKDWAEEYCGTHVVVEIWD